jgi:hypothetical protein
MHTNEHGFTEENRANGGDRLQKNGAEIKEIYNGKR